MKIVITHLKNWLNSIPIQDPIQRRMASLLQVILIGLIALILLATMVLMAMPGLDTDAKLNVLRGNFQGFLVVVLPLSLLRRGHFRASVLIIIAILIITPALAIIVVFDLPSGGGILIQFTLAIILSGLLVNRRTLILTFGLSATLVAFSAFQAQSAEPRLARLSIDTAINFILFNGLIAVFLDRFGIVLRTALTDALARERELQRSQERFSKAFLSSPAGLVISNLENGRLLEANEAYLRMTEYQREEVIGRTTTELNLISIAERTRFIEQLRQQGQLLNFEGQLQAKTGKLVTMLFSAVQIELEGTAHILLTTIDITERKRAERQVLQMKRLYATLSQVNQTIVRVKSQKELFESICQVAVDFGELRLAWIGLLDHETRVLTPVAVHSAGQNELPFESINLKVAPFQGSLISLSLQSGLAQFSSDIQADARMAHWHEVALQDKYHSAAAIPIKKNGQVVGVLNLYAADIDFFGAEEEQSLLNEMGLDISFALDTMESERIRRQWADAFEHCAHGIAIGLPSGKLLTCNPSFARTHGTTIQEISSIPILGMYAPQDHEQIKQFIAQADREGSVKFEANKLRQDGSRYPVEMALVSVRDENGNLLYRVATQQDITERKQAEEKFRLAIEAAPNAIIMVDASGAIILVNSQTETYFGYNRTELIGQNVDRLVPAGFRGEHAGFRASFFAEPQTRAMGVGRDLFGLRQDGSEFPVEIGLSPIETSSGLLVLATIVDITERKRAESELSKERELLRTLVDNMPEEVYVKDRDRRFLLINDLVAKTLGVANMDDVLGKRDEDFMPPVVASQFAREEEEIMLTGQPLINDEHTPAHKPGPQKWYLRTKLPLRDGAGNIIGIAGLGSDITERKQAEQKIQLQIQRLKALHAIDIAISSSFNLSHTLDVLLEQVIAQLKADAAAILLFHPTTERLQYAASRGFRSSAIHEASLRLGEGYAGRAVFEGRIIHIPNLSETGSELAQALLVKHEEFADYYCAPLFVKREVKGVLEVFHRGTLDGSGEWLDFFETLAGQAAIAIENASLFEDLQISNRELLHAYDATIEGWSHALDLRDKETEGHTLRVTDLTVALARRFDFTEEQLIYIRWGALLHDIGKMGVPDNILLKPSKLTDEEWVVMRQHPTFAFELLSPIEYLRPALDIPYCHHEKWDGSGYPRGLKGEQIPLVARLFAVIDVWDALRSDRPYRQGWSKEKVIEHIKSLSGTHFEPKVVEMFMNMMSEDEKNLE